MNPNDAIPPPPEEETLSELIADFLALINETVDRHLDDDEVEARLRRRMGASRRASTESAQMAVTNCPMSKRGPDAISRILAEILEREWTAGALTLQDARRRADEIVAVARGKADAYLDEALDRAARTVAEAREQAEAIVSEANAEADQIIEAAHVKAAKIVTAGPADGGYDAASGSSKQQPSKGLPTFHVYSRYDPVDRVLLDACLDRRISPVDTADSDLAVWLLHRSASPSNTHAGRSLRICLRRWRLRLTFLTGGSSVLGTELKKHRYEQDVTNLMGRFAVVSGPLGTFKVCTFEAEPTHPVNEDYGVGQLQSSCLPLHQRLIVGPGLGLEEHGRVPPIHLEATSMPCWSPPSCRT